MAMFNSYFDITICFSAIKPRQFGQLATLPGIRCHTATCALQTRGCLRFFRCWSGKVGCISCHFQPQRLFKIRLWKFENYILVSVSNCHYYCPPSPSASASSSSFSSSQASESAPFLANSIFMAVTKLLRHASRHATPCYARCLRLARRWAASEMPCGLSRISSVGHRNRTWTTSGQGRGGSPGHHGWDLCIFEQRQNMSKS